MTAHNAPSAGDHDPTLIAELVRVYALYSPCCGFLRLGLDWPEGAMHNGLCRQRHGGKLGKTIRLSGTYRPEVGS